MEKSMIQERGECVRTQSLSRQRRWDLLQVRCDLILCSRVYQSIGSLLVSGGSGGSLWDLSCYYFFIFSRLKSKIICEWLWRRKYGKFENEEIMYLLRNRRVYGWGKFTTKLDSIKAPLEDSNHEFKMRLENVVEYCFL